MTARPRSRPCQARVTPNPSLKRRPATAATVQPLPAKVGIVLPRLAGVRLHGRLSSNVRPHTNTCPSPRSAVAIQNARLEVLRPPDQAAQSPTEPPCAPAQRASTRGASRRRASRATSSPVVGKIHARRIRFRFLAAYVRRFGQDEFSSSLGQPRFEKYTTVFWLHTGYAYWKERVLGKKPKRPFG